MFTRREFLKLTGVGTLAAGTALVGLPGPLSLARRSSATSRRVATLCSDCPAGCAIEVTVAGGGILEVHGNPAHPLACPEVCTDVADMIRRLEAPARLHGPLLRSTAQVGGFRELSWPAATAMLGDIFAKYQPGEIAFVLGDFPDHLSDLVHRLAGALGGSTVLRFTASSLLDGRITLQDASRMLYGLPRLPYFDLPQSDLVFTFGLSGREPWLARFAVTSSRPVGQSWVHFTPHRPIFAGATDEWVCIRPGSEALVAQGLGRLIHLYKSGASLDQALPPEVGAASQASAVPVGELIRLAPRFADASAGLALPGADCLGSSDGLAAAGAVLALNEISGSLGGPGGVYLPPESPLHPELNGRTATLAEVQALIRRMQSGQIKALFVHGVDLVADLPAGLDVARALQQVEHVVLFNSLLNETTPLADALLPDHLPLESWGYHRLSPAVDRSLVSAIQPVLAPLYATCSTTDLLLDAAHRAGGELAMQLPYRNEAELLRQAVMRLPWQSNIADPWAQWLAQGGWWPSQRTLLPPVSLGSPERWLSHAQPPWPLDASGEEFYLLFTQPTAWQTDLPDRPGGPGQVGMHPDALRRLGLNPGDRIRLASASAEIEARVVEQPELGLDTLVMPLEQSRSGNSKTLDLVNGKQNESGDLAFQSGRVRVFLAS